jgi:general secretion pathway protein E/type IV pilus assembly protein PilB
LEVVALAHDVRELVKAKAPAREYRDVYAKRKISSLRRAGIKKIQEGVTTVDEVLRVT